MQPDAKELSFFHNFRPLEFFKGDWELSRIFSTGEKFVGTATFNLHGPDRLRYKEDGTLTTKDGRQFSAYRTYNYIFSNNHFDVYFDEEPMRLFQSIMWDGTYNVKISSKHVCKNDIYKTRYMFQSFMTFKITHVVIGPTKEYVSMTLYQRRLRHDSFAKTI